MWRTGNYKRAHLRPALTLHLARSERGSRWGAAVFKRPLQTRASPRSPCLLPHQTHGLLWVRPSFLEGKRQETLFDNGISFNQPCHGKNPRRDEGAGSRLRSEASAAGRAHQDPPSTEALAASAKLTSPFLQQVFPLCPPWLAYRATHRQTEAGTRGPRENSARWAGVERSTPSA